MKRRRYLLLGGLIFVLAFLATGCRTSYWEWSGAMANQSGSHVQPFNPGDQAQRTDAIRPAAWIPSPANQARPRK
jgi:hypothetical protein